MEVSIHAVSPLLILEASTRVGFVIASTAGAGVVGAGGATLTVGAAVAVGVIGKGVEGAIRSMLPDDDDAAGLCAFAGITANPNNREAIASRDAAVSFDIETSMKW